MVEGRDRPAAKLRQPDVGGWPEAAIVGDMDHGPEIDAGSGGMCRPAEGRGGSGLELAEEFGDMEDPSVPPWVLSQWILSDPPNPDVPIGKEPICFNPGLFVSSELATRIQESRLRSGAVKPQASLLRAASSGRPKRRVRWRDPLILGAQEAPEPEVASSASSAPCIAWNGGDGGGRSWAGGQEDTPGASQWWRGGGSGETDEWDSWSGAWAARSEGWCAAQSGGSSSGASWRSWSSPVGGGQGWGWQGEDGQQAKRQGADGWWQAARPWEQAASSWQASPRGAAASPVGLAREPPEGPPARRTGGPVGGGSGTPRPAGAAAVGAGGGTPPWAWSGRSPEPGDPPQAGKGGAREKGQDPLWDNWTPRDRTPDRQGGKPLGVGKKKKDWGHPDGLSIEELQAGNEVDGRVTNVTESGAFIDIGAQKDGLLSASECRRLGYQLCVGDRLARLVIGRLDTQKNRITLHAPPHGAGGPIGDGGWRGANREWSPKRGGPGRDWSPAPGARAKDSPARPARGGPQGGTEAPYRGGPHPARGGPSWADGGTGGTRGGRE